MKQALIGLTLAISLTAGGAWAEDEPVGPVGRYTTVVLSNGKIVVTDTQLGRVRLCYEVDAPPVVRLGEWSDEEHSLYCREWTHDWATSVVGE